MTQIELVFCVTSVVSTTRPCGLGPVCRSIKPVPLPVANSRLSLPAFSECLEIGSKSGQVFKL